MVSRAALDPALSVGGRRSAELRAEASAHRLLHRTAESVRAQYQHLPVTTHHLTEEAARTAAHPLCSARLLVVGTVGQHGRSAFSPDSVSRTLLKAARCPVLVVPQNDSIASARSHRIVTAGVGDLTDAAVVKAAWAQSLRLGCDLRVFHAYRDRPEETPAQGVRRAADIVARAMAAADVALGERCSVFLEQDEPVAALTRQARDAELLVIGIRPRSLSVRAQAVSLDVIRFLRCPLLVIPEPVPDPWSGRVRTNRAVKA
jgi:nucleotide-binding universal stress UspA family protein